MDKYESKLRIEEIEKLKKKKQYKEAARLADTIEWYRIKNAVTLYKVADLYKICRNYVKCRELLELAYERSPYAKNVVFALCDVCLEFGDFEAATEHYKEYKALAPDDAGVYVLKYKMLKALEAGIDEQIEVLESLKRKNRSEEWEYELATLYHRAGLAEKCVEECDEIVTWYGEGSFVYKAMELKMLHQPLDPEQQAIYDGRLEKKKRAEERRTGQIPSAEGGKKRHTGRIRMEEYPEKKKRRRPEQPERPVRPEREEVSQEEGNDEFHVKTINMGQFNTIDLQAELANNIQDYIGGEPSMIDRSGLSKNSGLEEVFSGEDAGVSGILPTEEPSFGASFQVKEDTTDSLLKIVAAAEEEERRSQALPKVSEDISEGSNADEIEFVEENRKEVFHNTIPADSQEVFFEDATGDLRFAIERPKKQESDDSRLEQFKENYSKQREGKELPEGYGRLDDGEPDYSETLPVAGGIVDEKVLEDGTVELIKHFEENVEPEVVRVGQDRKRPRGADGRSTGPMRVRKPVQEEIPAEDVKILERSELDPDYVDMLPASGDKQISGQLNIQDILAGWEETKKQKEREFQENLRKKTMENTGNMFADFEKEANSGLLATLENPALINSVTDQSTSEDFFKGLSVEDVKNGKQVTYPEKLTTGEIKISKVIEAPAEEEEEEEGTFEFAPLDYDPADYRIAKASDKKEEKNETEEASESDADDSAEEETKTETAENKDENAENQTAEEKSESEEEENKDEVIETGLKAEVEDADDESDVKENITEEDPDEAMIQKLLEEDEKEARERYYGSVTQKISGNIWDEVDNVPVKETYAEPEPDEVGATKLMPSRSLVEEIAVDNEETVSETAETTTEETVAEVLAKAEEEVSEAEETAFVDDEEEEKEVRPAKKKHAPADRPSGKDAKKDGKKKKSSNAPLVPHNTPSTEGFNMQPLTDEEAEEKDSEENAVAGIERDLTKEEKKYFGPFLYSKRMKQQILDAIETMTLAAYTGNLIITSDSGESSADLATLFYQYLKASDSNFTGKAAKIGAEKLNKKDMNEIFEKLSNGALIVSHAGKMTNSTINGILQNLNQEARGVEVILHDTKNEIRRLLERAPVLESFFNCRVDIIAMSPEMLAEYGKKYALDLGYSIDNMAMLAFSGRISELQIGTHLVSVDEVKEIVQAAIEHADKPSADKAIRTMTGKRYDEEHRVILREKDFEFRRN